MTISIGSSQPTVGNKRYAKISGKPFVKICTKGMLTTALYDLSKDPREETDISDQHPERVAEMEAIMRVAHH